MMESRKSSQRVVVNNVPIEWNEDGKGYTFFGIDSITFWKTPSLVSILNPLRQELGEELYSLIIAHEASKGTFEDYHSMVSTLGQSFEEGFLNWGRAVSAAGWGSFSIISVDFEKKEALIQIDDPWEMKIFRAENIQDAVPFLSGKISGIFSHAFKTNCRSEVIDAVNEESKCRVNLRIRPATESLEDQLLSMQKKRQLSQQDQLRAVNSNLRRNQQRLTDMLDTIGERIWETDKELVIRYVSEFKINNLVRSSQSLLGYKLMSFIHPEDVSLFQQPFEHLKAGRLGMAEVNARYRGTHHDYNWACFRFKSVLDISGKHDGFLGSVRDITSEVRLQKQLAEQKERTYHSSKMASLGEVASGIAHEINNPLAEIVGNIWIMKNEIKGQEGNLGSISSSLETIDKMSRRIAEIIKGMRSFSRDAGQDPFENAKVQTILDDTLVFVKKRFVNRGVELRVNLTDPQLSVQCRATQISQVLLNLLNNSFDAVLELKEKWIEVTAEQYKEGERGFVKLTVTDSGCGLPGPIIDKIMQPFFTTKEPGKGTGLGLPISRGIIESHKGRFYLDKSCPNTRFVILLPQKQED